MENKQTAVETFFNELVNLGFIEYPDDSLLQNRYKEALEMEKQQQQNEFERGYLKCADTLQFILDRGLKNNFNNECINL